MEFDEGKLKEPDDEALAKFCQTLKTIQARHSTVVQTMAQGVMELKDSHPVHNPKILSLSVTFNEIFNIQVDKQTEVAIQYFLDRLYMNRYSLRMLMYQVLLAQYLHLHKFVCLCFQHTLLFEPDADKDTNRIGMLDPKCKVKSVILQAFGDAANLCDDYYDLSPEINIRGDR